MRKATLWIRVVRGEGWYGNDGDGSGDRLECFLG